MTPVVTIDRDQPLLPEPERGESPSPRDVYRWAIRHGWSQEAAGNWAAWCAGIPLVVGEDLIRAWHVREVDHLIFLRELVASGRLDDDLEAAP